MVILCENTGFEWADDIPLPSIYKGLELETPNGNKITVLDTNRVTTRYSVEDRYTGEVHLITLETKEMTDNIMDGIWKTVGFKNLNETLDWGWADEIQPKIENEDDIQHMLYKRMVFYDENTGLPVLEDDVVLDGLYWIEPKTTSPQEYNICWNEIEMDGAVFKHCSTHSSGVITDWFRRGQFRFVKQNIKEDFDWMDKVPDVEFGYDFSIDDLDETIFIDKHGEGTVSVILPYDKFAEYVGNEDDYFFKMVVLSDGEAYDEYDGYNDSADDDDFSRVISESYVNNEQVERLKNILVTLGLDKETIDEGLENFLTLEEPLKEVYRGYGDYQHFKNGFLWWANKSINDSRWEYINRVYLKLLNEHDVKIEGYWGDEMVEVTFNYPFKHFKLKKSFGEPTVKYDEDTIYDITSILYGGFNFLYSDWGDMFNELYEPDRYITRIQDEFNVFLENLEESLNK